MYSTFNTKHLHVDGKRAKQVSLSVSAGERSGPVGGALPGGGQPHPQGVRGGQAAARRAEASRTYAFHTFIPVSFTYSYSRPTYVRFEHTAGILHKRSVYST